MLYSKLKQEEVIGNISRIYITLWHEFAQITDYFMYDLNGHNIIIKAIYIYIFIYIERERQRVKVTSFCY